MGLAIIDQHSHKVQTKLYKISKFGVNSLNSKQDRAICKWQDLQRNVWPSHPDVVRAQRLYGHTFLC